MTAASILEKARDKGWHIGTAESCTGGMVAAMLTDIPGSSDVFERGFVTYSNQAKIDLLGVRADTLNSFGAVSEEVAWEMAEGVLKNAPVQLAVSITGIAGPGGSPNKPEGHVCFGLAVQGQSTRTETVQFGALGRDGVRQASALHALRLLLEALS